MKDKAPGTATTRTVTRINRTAILDALQRGGPSTRAQLRETTGLSPATVQRLCAALLDDGMIVVDRTVSQGVGRPTDVFRYAARGRVAVALEVRRDAVVGALVDLEGRPLARVRAEHDADASGPDTRVRALIDQVDALVALAAGRRETVLGLGIAVPGVVDAGGRVSYAPELAWHDVPLSAIVAARTDLPVVVENSSNAIAYGEWRHGAAVGSRSAAALVLGVGVGVGAGVVHEGAVVRGHRAAAGELGYLLTGRAALGTVFTMQGDLESQVQGAAEAHDTPAVLDHLAMAVAALAVVLDPECVVLAGALPGPADDVARDLDARLVGRVPSVPRLVPAALGDDAALLGVGTLTAEQVRGSVYLA